MCRDEKKRRQQCVWDYVAGKLAPSLLESAPAGDRRSPAETQATACGLPRERHACLRQGTALLAAVRAALDPAAQHACCIQAPADSRNAQQFTAFMEHVNRLYAGPCMQHVCAGHATPSSASGGGIWCTFNFCTLALTPAVPLKRVPAVQWENIERNSTGQCQGTEVAVDIPALPDTLLSTVIFCLFTCPFKILIGFNMLCDNLGTPPLLLPS